MSQENSDSELPEEPASSSEKLEAAPSEPAGGEADDKAAKKRRWLARVATLKAAKAKVKSSVETFASTGRPAPEPEEAAVALKRLAAEAVDRDDDDEEKKPKLPVRAAIEPTDDTDDATKARAAAMRARADAARARAEADRAESQRELQAARESERELDTARESEHDLDAASEREPAAKPATTKARAAAIRARAAKADAETEPPSLRGAHDSDPPKSEPRTEWKAEPPKTELRLRRLEPAPPDRSRLYAGGVIGILVAAGIGLMLASPKKPALPTPPPLALTSGDITDAGTATVAQKEATPDAAAVPIVRPPPVWRVSALKDDANLDYVEGSFGKKGLVATLTGAGLARSEIKRLVKAFDDVKHIDRPAAGDRFALAKDKKGNVVAFEYIASPFDVWQAKSDDADAGAKASLDANKLDFFIEHKHVASAFVIKEDLSKTLAANNMKPELVDEIDDALEGHVEDGIHNGARIRFISTEDLVDGNLARVHLDAVELVPRSGNGVRVYYYERGSDVEGSAKRAPAAGFYDGKGRQPYHGQFRPPLQLARITSRFNPNRMHPVLHVVMPHNGVDFAGSTGTPIYASAAGTVLTAGDSGPCGNMVSIDHGGGITTSYCHMSRIAPGIHAGVHVDSRQNIGFVGATGRVTGPHLHFVAKRNGQFIDPMTLKMDGVRVLPPADRDAFAAKRHELDGALDGTALPTAPTTTEAPDTDTDSDEDKDLHE